MGADDMDDILSRQHSSRGDQPSPTFRIFELDRVYTVVRQIVVNPHYVANLIKFPVQF